MEIADKVKADLISLKAVLPLTISRASGGDFLLNYQKINEYYGVSNLPNKTITVSLPRSTEDVLANIKLQKSSSIPGVGAPETPIDEDDPMLRITEEAYRGYYWEATLNFTDLSSYISELNGIASAMLADWGVSEERKVLMYTEIEMLKQYATDLETNPDYWINLYAPQDDSLQAASVFKTNSIMSVGNTEVAVKTTMAGNPPRQGCKINTRGVLMGAVLSGFSNAVRGGTAGAIAGTFTVPGVGTVTGAVSGFMTGFAAGFVSGVVYGVVGELMTSCFR